MTLYDIILKTNESLFVISQGGAGKTSQLLFAYEKLLEESEKTKTIPLFIPLNEYDGKGSTYVQDYIIHSYLKGESIDSHARDCFWEMLEKSGYKYVLLIDGLNETSVMTGRLTEEIKKISECENVRVVVTGRHDDPAFEGFKKLALQPLEDSFAEKNIESYSSLSMELRELLKIPYYYVKYKKIKSPDKAKATSAAELMDLFYKELLSRAEKTADGGDYYDFCKLILEDFVPYFAYERMNKGAYLTFSEDECNALWADFKIKNDVVYQKRCIKVLCELDIVKRTQDKMLSFCHDIGHTYFAAKHVTKAILNSCDEEKVLKDTDSNSVLKMVGELLGEHNGKKGNSPVEKLLDKYKGVFDGSKSAIVGKYVDIMRLCGRGEVCRKLTKLDLTAVAFYGGEWNNSNFDESVFDENFTIDPTFEKRIKLVYVTKNGKSIVAGDMKAQFVVLDERLNVKSVIAPPDVKNVICGVEVTITDEKLYAGFHASKFDREKLAITEDIYAYEYDFKENTVKACEWNSSDKGILYRKSHYKETDMETITGEDIVKKASMNEYEPDIYTHKDTPIRVTCSNDVMRRYKGKKYYERRLLKNNKVAIYTSDEGFNFTSGKSYEGDLYVETHYYGRIYDTKKRKCTLAYGHECNHDIDEIHGFFYDKPVSFDKLSYVRAIGLYDYYNPFRLVKKIDNVPIKAPFKKQLYDNGVLFYNENEAGWCCFDDCIPKKFDAPIQGKIVDNGVAVYENIMYILYERKTSLHLIRYDLKENRVIEDVNTYIAWMHDAVVIEDDKLERVRISPTTVSVYDHSMLHIFYIHKNANISIDFSVMGIKRAQKMHVCDDGVIFFHSGGYCTKLSLTFEKDAVLRENSFALTPKTDKLCDEQKVYDGKSKRPIMTVKKEYEIQFIEHIDIRGCSFENAVIKTAEGKTKPMPEKILFNT